MTNLLLVALGGAFGSSLRYITGIFFINLTNYTFISTLFVNILGSFLIGLLISALNSKEISEDFIKYFCIIGFLGSYTTFSAFSLETVELYTNNFIFLSLAYVLLSFILCIVAAYIGLNLEKIIN